MECGDSGLRFSKMVSCECDLWDICYMDVAGMGDICYGYLWLRGFLE